jgi:hypothetical protein
MTTGAVTRAPDRVFAGYALDLDGTVYLGDELLDGAWPRCDVSLEWSS